MNFRVDKTRERKLKELHKKGYNASENFRKRIDEDHFKLIEEPKLKSK